MTDDELPPAYNGCKCPCHTTPGIKHIRACCGPKAQSPSDAEIKSMKRAATRLKKATPGMLHTDALNRIARERGYRDGWWGVCKALKGKA